MFHIAAYNQTSTGAITLGDVPAVTDGILTIQNNHFLPQQALNLLAAHAGAATITEAQLNSPKIRQINPTFIRPVDINLLAPTNYNWQMYYPYSLMVNGQEELQMLITDTNASGEAMYGEIWLADQVVPWPSGETYVCKFTSTGTATSGAWTLIPYTMATLLPAGQYAMLWSELTSTHGIAHRWVFDLQTFRPGFLMQASLGSRHPYEVYEGVFGQMGLFYTYALPRLEVLCNAGDTSFTGYFAVTRMGPPASEAMLTGS